MMRTVFTNVPEGHPPAKNAFAHELSWDYIPLHAVYGCPTSDCRLADNVHAARPLR